jgi:glycosyltransferase involved in cell wall biosynthesis
MSAPLISVVIPVWNCERHIGEAVGSVLSQGWTPLQIVLVDDGSTDGSVAAALAAAPEIEVVRQSNQGIGAARNAGVQRARGELLAFLDSDDRWTPGKLRRQAALLADASAVDGVFGYVRQFYSPELPEAAALSPPEPSGGPICSSMLIRTAAFHRVGPFAHDVKVGEFIDWYARAQEAGLRFEIEREVALERRIHGRNTVTRERDSRLDYVRVLKAALDRRRAAQQSDREGQG